MDKNLVNNQIVLMRKIVRKGKRYVYQKDVKQIKKLKTFATKNVTQESTKKYDHKIDNKRKELAILKTVNVDEVSKQALIHNKQYFEDIITNIHSTIDMKCLAKIAINEMVAKAVEKFKEENPNCDEWLPSQIEIWTQKKAIKRNKILKKKGINVDENEVSENEETNLSKAVNHTSESTDNNLNDNKRKIKKINKSNTKSDKNVDKPNNQLTPEINKTKSDPFFLSDNMESNDEEEEEDSEQIMDENVFRKRTTNGKNNIKEKRYKLNEKKGFEKSHKRFETKDFQNQKTHPKNINRNNNNNNKIKDKSYVNSGESLHPSWAAKSYHQKHNYV
ncbi:myb-like protein I [Oppia nitens]|uniref:myb-like protein I n=1 Tax=Oppia nitens TaxID=1686743 RepID=UPI0023DA237B|nr:myb-like protein I [Oppia nitens]